MTATWGLATSGSHRVVLWSYGGYMGVVWELYGGYMEVIWGLYGGYLGLREGYVGGWAGSGVHPYRMGWRGGYTDTPREVYCDR